MIALDNGYIESFNARLRDEFLNGEIFCTLKEARILIEAWRRHYNTVRPHGSLGYRPPAPGVIVPSIWTDNHNARGASGKQLARIWSRFHASRISRFSDLGGKQVRSCALARIQR